MGNSFDSLRVPRNASNHSVVPTPTDEQSLPTDDSSLQKSDVALQEPQPPSPHVSSEICLNRADSDHNDENAEKKVYPVSLNLSVLVLYKLVYSSVINYN